MYSDALIRITSIESTDLHLSLACWLGCLENTLLNFRVRQNLIIATIKNCNRRLKICECLCVYTLKLNLCFQVNKNLLDFKLVRIMWQHCKLIDSTKCRIVRFRCVQQFSNILSSAINHWLWNVHVRNVHVMQTTHYHEHNDCRWLCDQCSEQITIVGII